MPWHQLTVTTTEQSAPKVAKHFTHLGAVSVTYMDAEDEPVYEPKIGETKIWTNTQVEALFELDVEPEDVKAAMNKNSKPLAIRGNTNSLKTKHGNARGWSFISR